MTIFGFKIIKEETYFDMERQIKSLTRDKIVSIEEIRMYEYDIDNLKEIIKSLKEEKKSKSNAFYDLLLKKINDGEKIIIYKKSKDITGQRYDYFVIHDILKPPSVITQSIFDHLRILSKNYKNISTGE
jgi:c-di-AMP phosphodiesterase-like protein